MFIVVHDTHTDIKWKYVERIVLMKELADTVINSKRTQRTNIETLKKDI